MSVPVTHRNENRLEVFNKTLALVTYTIDICCNPKVFTPEYQRAITDDIVDKAKSIHINAWRANAIRVITGSEYELRRAMQVQSIADCVALLALIDIAKKVFHLKAKRITYWASLITEAHAYLAKWKEADSKRYSSLL